MERKAVLYHGLQETRHFLSVVGSISSIMSKEWFPPQAEMEDRTYSDYFIEQAVGIMMRSLTSSARPPGFES